MSSKRRTIDPRRMLFVGAYIKPGATLTEAARAAGYGQGSNDETVKRWAKRFVKEPDIQRAVARQLDIVLRRRGLTLERLLDHLAKIAYATMDDYRDVLFSDDPERALAELGPDLALAIEAMEVETDPDRIEADDKTGKRQVIKGQRRVKLKLRSNLEATRLLAIHHGMRTGRALAIVNTMGPGDRAQRSAELRQGLAYLSDDEKQQLEAMCEKIMQAEERAAKAPLIEQRPQQSEEEGGDG